jgi:hypothetical protein
MEVLDSKWSSHPDVVASMIGDLRLVEEMLLKAENGDAAAVKSWNKCLSTLMDAGVKVKRSLSFFLYFSKQRTRRLLPRFRFSPL